MANFLIQTVDGQIKHDFCFGLVEAIEYQNWLNKGTHDYYLSDINDIWEHDYTTCIPCGTIQFVSNFLDFYHNIKSIKPINIPQQLNKPEFTKRIVKYVGEGLYSFPQEKFFKSHSYIKGFTEITKEKQIDCSEAMISDLIEIESEWRAFVFNNKLVGLQSYIGDFTMFPDVKLIQDMIETYADCPPAYTLDVGVNSIDGTFIIEVHNMWSVGLYGFSDYKILPQMFIRSFRHLVQRGW